MQHGAQPGADANRYILSRAWINGVQKIGMLQANVQSAGALNAARFCGKRAENEFKRLIGVGQLVTQPRDICASNAAFPSPTSTMG